jgi:hypothetical protein
MKQQADMDHSRSGARAAVRPGNKQPNVPEYMRGDVLGQLVDLGFVSGPPELVMALSWAAQDYMSTVVTRNSTDIKRRKKDLAEANCGGGRNGSVGLVPSVWPLDRILPFRLPNGRWAPCRDTIQ